MTDILARQRQLIGTTAEWGADDLVLGNGEIAVERVSATEIKIKIGDGVNKFSALPYVAGGTTGGPSLQLTGGTLTGPLVLPAGAPTGRQAVSKDEADKLYVLVSNLLATSAGAASAGKVPKLDANGKLDASFISIQGGMTFKGTIDPTAAAPATPAVGDYYFASKQATLGATWTGLAGTHIKANDSLLYDGTKWHTGAAVADLDSFVSKAGDTMTGKLVVPDVAVSGGTIDGTVIGGNTPAAGAFTTLSATGVATFSAGSAAAPSITTSGDTNNGIFFPAADVTAITTAGSERMRIDSSGNVGIGTINPGDKLDVKGIMRLSGSTSGYVGLAPAAAAGSTTYTLPSADGSSGQVLSTNGSGTLSWATDRGVAPTTQVFTTGSGTYTTPANCKAIFIRMIGGGGGGQGSGSSRGGGGAGGNTTFGTALLVANGGPGGSDAAQVAGGTASGGDINIVGGSGGGASSALAAFYPGGGGGNGPFGGGGPPPATNNPGIAGTANTGGGGSGGGSDGTGGAAAAAGGGAGGYLEKTISLPSATYSYAVGAGGTDGTGSGGSAFNGGAGGSGVIIVTEYY